MAITYSSREGVRIPAFKRRAMGSWLRAVAAKYDREIVEAAYQFCDNEQIRELNSKFLGHDYYTDIITFDSSPDDSTIIADIVISLEEVELNAEEYGTGFRNELLRVMVHGILHMCGFDDHTEEEIREMRAAEDDALALLPPTIW